MVHQPPPPPPDGKKDRVKPEARQGLTALAGAGLEFAGVVAILTLLGWWADGKLGTAPWLVISGMAIGLIGGMYKLWRIGKRFFE
ncbi:MAG: AtpZ/AtpI family protein [Phycisphaeraceae bacterium]